VDYTLTVYHTGLVDFMYKIVVVVPRSIVEAKRWIGRTVFMS
jgi:hypothetical protein